MAGHVNLRSLIANYVQYILTNNFDIFGLSETWLNRTVNTNQFNIPGTIFLERIELVGVGFYIKNIIKVICLNHNNFDSLEHLWLRIKVRTHC